MPGSSLNFYIYSTNDFDYSVNKSKKLKQDFELLLQDD